MINKRFIAGLLLSAAFLTNIGYANEIQATKITQLRNTSVLTGVNTNKNYLKIADAELCKGEILKITKEGKLDILVKTKGNTNEEILFHADENTKFNVEKDNLKVGDKVDIFYSGILTRSIPPQGTAIAVNLIKEEANVYSGEVKEIVSTKYGKMLSVISKDKNQNFEEIVFNVTKTTKFKRGTLKNFKKGTKVIVEYGNIMTLSLPPQTNAISIELVR